MSEGLRQLNRYTRLIYEIDLDAAERFQMTRHRGNLWLTDTRSEPNEFPEMTESTMARIVSTSRRWFGDRQFLRGIHVTHADPGYRSEYERIFRVPIRFKSDKNALIADEDWLTWKTGFPSQYVFGILSERAEELLKTLESSKTMRGRVESLLMPLLHTGDVTVDVVARKLAMSRSTLFRKLRAEGTTFESILDELRHRLAVYYISGRKASVNETAYLVGFSEAASFSRAFKRWTGMNPSEMKLEDNMPTD
jgi:AraC-like DNA-binding protein